MRTLRRRAIELLHDEWKRGGEAAVGSDDVYRRLIEEGWEVPDYELKELWELLVVERQVRAWPAVDAEATRQHGDRRITWVNRTFWRRRWEPRGVQASRPQGRG